jgi:hypothetical protein
MALKLLATEFIKDAWFANSHYQTRLYLMIWTYTDCKILGVDRAQEPIQKNPPVSI